MSPIVTRIQRFQRVPLIVARRLVFVLLFLILDSSLHLFGIPQRIDAFTSTFHVMPVPLSLLLLFICAHRPRNRACISDFLVKFFSPFVVLFFCAALSMSYFGFASKIENYYSSMRQRFYTHEAKAVQVKGKACMRLSQKMRLVMIPLKCPLWSVSFPHSIC